MNKEYKNNKKEIKIRVDLEKFRISLIGDGFTPEEVKNLNERDLKNILQKRFNDYIESEYEKSMNFIEWQGLKI